MKRVLMGCVALSLLGGCGVFGGGDKKPKTPVLGERIPVLASETGAELDPALAGIPVQLPGPVENAEWSQPGGNPAKSMGHVALPSALGRAWTAKVAGSSKKARLASAPVVAEGKVFVIDTEATVHAFNVTDGRKLWSTRVIGDKQEESALFGGGVSYAGGKLYATNGYGNAAALDAATGAVQWKVRPGGPLRGAPTVADNTVYVVTQDNQLFALKAENGETAWTESGTLEAAGVFGAAAPAVAQGTVVAGFSSGELNAYRYENGRIVWQDALSRTSISTSVAALSDIDASPVIDQGRVFAVGQGGRMVALELVTGQRVWELNVAGIATPWVAGEWLFVVTDDARVLCVARGTGKVRWMTQLPRWRDEEDKKGPISWSGPVLAGGRLLLASSTGQLVNVMPDGIMSTGTRIGAPVYLSPVVAANTLFLLDDEGRLSAWR